ncbi:hypothetical protein EMIHUDRAFT_453752 [Emiliania huxleyi CCMP1516]|uniref:Uncharacterized protein n=2 Tax=Emiliania huxleyi TaxID=2903 RepID=A0A0D3I0M8_EMIH1|nr:hypothetical protein EMIHUDRAFT_453752 [Emiliania huxleyi CCMP1516]EOD04813.1 hypothetical protein EMIHUDRAFT_453752 [Emiliania huxleyi CCMP1516]|eukprot:XP_005757242.1 hypothetical protein EMIHUDRAFT_453752 [Emiliania huxleyi CCMP1516]
MPRWLGTKLARTGHCPWPFAGQNEITPTLLAARVDDLLAKPKTVLEKASKESLKQLCEALPLRVKLPSGATNASVAEVRKHLVARLHDSAAEAARVESDRIAAEAAAAEPAHANVSNYTATEGLQKLEQAEMAVTAQKARHGGDEAAGAKALYQQSKLKVDEKLEQFKEREHIEVAPVYLGDIHRPEYANLKQTITTGKMQRMIEKEFYTMLERTFKHHPLKEYFEPRSDGKQGYQPKTVSQGLAGNRKETMFDIDHVVPDNWGGINHPRIG